MKKNLFLIIGLILFVAATGCHEGNSSKMKSHPIHMKVRLKDMKEMTLWATLYSNTPKGLDNIKAHERDFRFAFTMVMTRQTSNLFLTNNRGKHRMNNVLRSIARQILHEDNMRIKIDRYDIK